MGISATQGEDSPPPSGQRQAVDWSVSLLFRELLIKRIPWKRNSGCFYSLSYIAHKKGGCGGVGTSAHR